MPDPTLFGRYRVDQRIGSGAFATVWLAHDDLLDSPVAVKVLAENWTDRLDIRSRFAEEARILRRADSDHVVRVHDIGELDDGRPYFVMTYADAGTLADRLTGPLSEALVVQHALGVAEGLAVLHRLGVVHRDVKPSNVLFHSGREAERLLIADLGLARAVAHASGFTLAAGTPGYMAPEQGVMGGSIDARADVYALGALITHMLSGHTPRRVSDERSAMFALHDADAVPGRLGDVVRRSLAPYPQDRYPSAVEVAAALRQVHAGQSQLERPNSERQRVVGPTASLVQRRTPVAPTYLAEPSIERPADRSADQPVDRSADLAAEQGGSPVLGRSRVFRSRSRRRRIVAASAAVVVLAGAGGGGYAYWQSRSGTRVVHASDVTVRVPRSWSGQVKSGNWQLGSFGLKGQSGKGIVVSSDVAAWDRDGSNTPGVFIGVSSQLQAKPDKTLLAKINHPGCTHRPQPLPDGISGDRVQWTGCSGGMTFDEAVERHGNFVVYVQVKQAAGAGKANSILGSITVAR